jgi:lipoate-protein ligase A
MSLKPARLIDSGVAYAAWNMAIDEALLRLQPQIGRATLRFYSWEVPTLSIGYFQKSASVNLEACQRRGFAYIRRPTGGRAVLHDKELTYSFICGLDQMPPTINDSHEHISRALARGLRRLGFEPQLARKSATGKSDACFDAPSYSELTIEGKKVAGSAQTRSREALLEHGSIPLEFDAELLTSLLSANGRSGSLAVNLRRRAGGLNELSSRAISMEELKRAVKSGFEEEFGLALEPGELSNEERDLARELLVTKYRSDGWNLQR